jgi:predicted RNA methylase
MGAPGAAKTGGRRPGSKNKPRPPTDAPAPDIAPAAAAKFPPYRLARVSDLIPYERNARLHTPESVDALARQITANKWTNPILVAGKHILAGHRRRLAAIKLGLDMVPTIDLSHLSKTERRAYIIWDNKSALNATWDNDLLALELGELRDDGFDLSLTGFDGLELDSLLGNTMGDTDPDDAPPVQAEAVSRLGDVWLLGDKHKLHCADCMDVLPTLTGIDAVVTDPPYGIDYNHSGVHRFASVGVSKAARERGNPPIVGDDKPFDPAPLLMFKNVLMWGADHYRLRLPEIGRFLAFDKLAGMEPWDSFSDVEFAWHSVGKASRIFSMKWKGVACDKAGEDNGLRLHTTQKPIRLMKWCIEETGVAANATILDPFSGSGTTIIAAEMTGRACVAIEIEPRYCDVAVRRWQSFTSAVATLESDGRTFADVEADRVKAAA